MRGGRGLRVAFKLILSSVLRSSTYFLFNILFFWWQGGACTGGGVSQTRTALLLLLIGDRGWCGGVLGASPSWDGRLCGLCQGGRSGPHMYTWGKCWLERTGCTSQINLQPNRSTVRRPPCGPPPHYTLCSGGKKKPRSILQISPQQKIESFWSLKLQIIKE